MSGKNQKLISEMTSSEIKKEFTRINAKFMNAKNEYFQYLVSIDLLEIALQDLAYWENVLACLEKDDTDAGKAILADAEKQVEGSIKMVEEVKNHMISIRPTALKIQQAMINMHELKVKMIPETDELTFDETE